MIDFSIKSKNSQADSSNEERLDQQSFINTQPQVKKKLFNVLI